MASLPKVYFFFEKKDFSLKGRTGLKLFIEQIFKQEKKELGYLNCIFCSDKRLLEINRQFLQHDYYTDIITFELSTSGLVQAEIYISVDRVKDNARKLGTSFKSELHRVMFHGVLHLCGYGDKSNAERTEMRKREEFWLNTMLYDVSQKTVS